MANNLGIVNRFNSWVNKFNRNYGAPVSIKNNQPKKRNLVIKNKICVLIQSKETYDFVSYILKEKGKFTRDVYLVYCGNKNILTVLQNQFNNGFRFFLSDHDDDELIKINTFKRINEILIFNSISTQDIVILSPNIIRSSTPDYNYIYFIIVSLLYTPKEALVLLSLTSQYVDISKLRRKNASTLVDTLVYVYIENNEFSVKTLNYILRFNALMGNIIKVKSFAISLTSNTISPDLSSLLSSNGISGINYEPTLFYVNSSNNTESEKLLSVLSSQPSFIDNYFLFSDTFLNAAFTTYFPYCFIVARNFSQEGYRYAKSYNSNLTAFNFSLYDFLIYLIPTISNNTENVNTIFKKLKDDNTIKSNSVNPKDIMFYFNIKQSYIYTIDSNLIKRPIAYRVKTNPFLTGELDTTTRSYDVALYRTNVRLLMTTTTLFTKSSKNGGGLMVYNQTTYVNSGDKSNKLSISNNTGNIWFEVLPNITNVLDGCVTEIKIRKKKFYIFLIATNTDLYFIMLAQNVSYTLNQIYVSKFPFIQTQDNEADRGNLDLEYMKMAVILGGNTLYPINKIMLTETTNNQYYVLINDICFLLTLSFNTFSSDYRKFFVLDVGFYNLYNPSTSEETDRYNYYFGYVDYYGSTVPGHPVSYSEWNNFISNLTKFYNQKTTTINNIKSIMTTIPNQDDILYVLDNKIYTISGKNKGMLLKFQTENFRISNINFFNQDDNLMMYYSVQDKLYLTNYNTLLEYPNAKMQETLENGNVVEFSKFTMVPLLSEDILIYMFPNTISDLSCNSDGTIICVTATDTNTNVSAYNSNDSGKSFKLIQLGDTVDYFVTKNGYSFLSSPDILKTTAIDETIDETTDETIYEIL